MKQKILKFLGWISVGQPIHLNRVYIDVLPFGNEKGYQELRYIKSSVNEGSKNTMNRQLDINTLFRYYDQLLFPHCYKNKEICLH